MRLYCFYILLSFCHFAQADLGIITSNRIYHHVSGKKFQLVYGSRVTELPEGDIPLFTLNTPDADQNSILVRTKEALEIWLRMYEDDGFMVPGKDDELIEDYRSNHRLDQHDDFILAYELLAPEYQTRKLIGFWGMSRVDGMEKSFGIKLHRRPLVSALTNPIFFPTHWRAPYSAQVMLLWQGRNPLSVGPVWTDSEYPWIFSLMFHSGHWDAGITMTEQEEATKTAAPLFAPNLVMPSDLINWSAPRNGVNSRARLFRNQLCHEPLLIDGSSTVEWHGKKLELSTIPLTTFIHELASELRRPAFVEFIQNSTPGPLHLGMAPWTSHPEALDWNRTDVIRTPIDKLSDNTLAPNFSCASLIELMSSFPLVHSLGAGPRAPFFRATETVTLEDGTTVFRPLWGTKAKVTSHQ